MRSLTIAGALALACMLMLAPESSQATPNCVELFLGKLGGKAGTYCAKGQTAHARRPFRKARKSGLNPWQRHPGRGHISLPLPTVAANDERYPKAAVPAERVEITAHQDRRQARGAARAAARARELARPAPEAAPAGIVTVATAAGIPIKVASSVAHKFVGFIADLVDRGIKPDRIHCYASGGHVRNSFHYRGEACDFNGSASRWAPMNHGRVADIARKWGLRDGCSFAIGRGRPDCGHIDAGLSVPRHTRMARR